VRNINVSVIICTKNRQDDLVKCIDSLTIQTYPIFEIILINSGDQKLDNIIYKYKNKINFKYNLFKSSLTVARNLGIKESEGDIILFLDDDVILDCEYVYNIVFIFKNYGSTVGAVSGNIVSDKIKSKRFSKSTGYILNKDLLNIVFKMFFLTAWGNGRFQPSGFPTHPIWKKKVLFIECIQGANMAFRREVLDKFKFDENLQGYCFMEDCDISYRVAQKYKIIYTPYAKLTHNFSPASRDSERLRMKMFIENHYYLFNKNFPQTFHNRLAFWVSIFGLFFIYSMEMNKESLKGLFSGFKIIIYNKFRNIRISKELIKESSRDL
jgi:glycosyltransferase involved in cell wall biosynthesis